MSADPARLEEELAALRLANTALEQELLAGAQATEAMLAELEAQRNALREAHRKQRDLGAFVQRVMDTVGSMVIVLGPDGRVRHANRRCEEELGERAHELMGRALDEMLHPDERAALASALPELPWAVASPLFETVRRQGNYCAEHRLAGCSGRYRHFLLEAALLHDHRGQEDGAVVNATDITTLKEQAARLAASEARLNEAQRIARLGSWELDLGTNRLTWSDEVYRIFELDPERFAASYEAFLDAIHPDDRALVDQAYTTSFLTRQHYVVEHRLLLASGRVKWVLESGRTDYDDHGAPLRSIGTVQDITERRQAEDELKLAASVFDNSLNGILITSPDGVIRKVNRAFTQITGFTAAEAVGRTPRLLKSEHHEAAFYRHMWMCLVSTGEWQGEVWNRRRDGRVIPLWQSISPLRDAAGRLTNFIGIFYDISEQKASAERIEHLAHYDVLTDLPNRLLLMDRCEHALERARRDGLALAVLFLDLDRFKQVNDSLGHPVGDELLRAVAIRLRQALREQDTLARLGGDEFVIVLEDVESARQVETVIHKLLAAFAEPFPVRGHNLSVGTSIGASLFPSDGADVTTLIKQADLALYRAKEQGRGGFQFFEPQFTEQATERLQLEGDLRHALARGELVVFYQPQYALDGVRLVGAEALVRWRHPRRGLVPPDAFIPIAEDTGLIVPIGEWVLREACRQARAWLDAGLDLKCMAVNLSGVQIQRGDIVASVARALADTGLAAERLELEITETYIMTRAERDIRVLEGLRALGVALAIDDFGTGQSSLGYLKRLPVGKLKIDRSFIMDIPHDASGATIARAILGLGRGLHLTVLAEGVETPEQEAFLAQIGCDEVQGYRYSRPLDAGSFTDLLGRETMMPRQARSHARGDPR